MKTSQYIKAPSQYDIEDVFSLGGSSVQPRTSSPLSTAMPSILESPGKSFYLPKSPNINDQVDDKVPLSQTTDQSEKCDTSFSFCNSSSSGSDSDSESDFKEAEAVHCTTSLQGDSTFIIFNSCIQELLQYCPSCGAPTASFTHFCTGTLLTVKIICLNGHDIKWSSQPLISGIPAGNLTAAAGIMFSGETYKRLSFFADILKLSFISESTYHRIQDQYLFSVVDQT